MATVNLEGVWLHDASDLSTTVQLALNAGDISARDDVDGEVRAYAAGNRRSHRQAGSDTSVEVVAGYVPRGDVDTLIGWVGERLMYRDLRGRKLWGVYWSLDVDEYGWRANPDIRFTFEQVTHDEEV